ncbi:ABC transporter permease [Candidatus Galacturonibacter soehngenii]|uniref:ABC transporter permease n=1 Tax=Candidatus Galacturonatibacter soehngenii TaxID=2307010 RepID=A0A7V7QLM6_9FIRM|nr:ABC transporter permease [Candidatus Galacturonibacter soehngenii]KAB1438613.1 ABC transporter permease [Candidatus Galacturonibacter soehngenii]MBA4685640.1 ABC transporter permease [Candidatus Galacturonibacter soehngenii]
MRALRIEFLKIRYKKIWLIVFSIIIVQGLWQLWAVRKMDANDLVQGWMFCLYQFPVLNTIMMPITAAVVASRLCDVEHKGEMLKLLYTVIPEQKLFFTKFLCGALFMTLATILQVFIIVTIGSIKGFVGSIPMDKMLYYFVFTVLINVTILLIQQLLSLHFKNQMIPITIGLLGSFMGLFSLFFPEGIKRFLIWSYYGVLLLVGMDWNEKTRVTNYYYTSPDWIGFFVVIFVFVAVYALSLVLIKRREI